MNTPPSPPDALNQPCPACLAQEAEAALTLHDWTYTGKGPFGYQRCCRCGALYAAESLSPSELAPYYPTHYAAYVDRAARSRLGAMAQQVGLLKRCRAVERLRTGGRLLDVGCGAGAFVETMQARGWSAVGLERDAGAAQAARARGLDVRTGQAPGYPFAPGSFDVITLWDVLEHMEQPGVALRGIAAWLAPGGWLVLRTPDAACLQARLFGRWWAGYDAPRHRVIYTRRALESLLRASALEPQPLPGPTGSYALATLSVQNGVLGGRWPRWVAQAMSDPAGQALCLLPTALLDRIAGGAELLVAAQRR
jgi:SAM-dependent methyltransferase